MTIRRAEADDLPEILRIYNQSVTGTTATFDLEPVTVAERQDWFRRFDDEDPLFVSVAAGAGPGLGGFAYYLPYRAKAAYDRTKELSVYVDHASHGQGIGSRLMEALLSHAATRDVHVLVGVIAGGNPASVALHEKFGFEPVGCLREVGRKFGRWIDTAFYQKVLEG